MYHRHNEKGLNWEPGGVRSGAGVRSESGVVRFIRDLGGNVLPAVLEAVAVAVYLQDVAVMGEAVQQRSRQPLRPEDRGPFFEGEVGDDQNEPALAALAADPKEEVRPGPVQLRTTPKKAPLFCAGT